MKDFVENLSTEFSFSYLGLFVGFLPIQKYVNGKVFLGKEGNLFY